MKIRKISNFIIQLTLECNKNCKHCYNIIKKDPPNNITAQELANFVFLYPSKKIHILFGGGEPLLEFGRMKQIINECRLKSAETGKDVDYCLVSNLILMDRQILDFIVKNNILVVSSLDGSFKSHSFSKGTTEEEYKRIIDNFRLLNKKGLVGIVTIVDKEINNTPGEIIDIYDKIGLKKIHIRPKENLGRSGSSLYCTNSEFFFDFWHIFHKEAEKRGFSDLRHCSYKERLEFSNSCPQYSLPCREGSINVAIDPKGDVYPCDESVGSSFFRIGNINNQLLREKLKKGIFDFFSCKKIMGSIIKKTKCRTCKLFNFCGPCPIRIYNPKNKTFQESRFLDYCSFQKKSFDFVKGNLGTD